MGEFERGYFSFYNFNKKKDLYLKGKKGYNYSCVKPNFSGRFVGGYTVDEKIYSRAKYLDMIRQEEDSKKSSITKLQKLEITREVFKKLRKRMPKITLKDWSVGFDVSERTMNRYLAKENVESEGVSTPDEDTQTPIMKYPIQEDDVLDGGEDNK